MTNGGFSFTNDQAGDGLKTTFVNYRITMKRYLLVIFVLVAITQGCTTPSKKDETPTNGFIKYRVSYSEALQNNSLYSFFPKELTSVFKGGLFKIQAKGALNMYQFELVNSGADSIFALVQFFDQKFICSLNPKENNMLSSLLSTATVQFYEDSITAIAGLNSSLMIINFNNPEGTRINMHYASNRIISSEKGLFSIVPGIITRMVFEHSGNSILIDACEVKEQTVEQAEFARPLDFRKTGQEEIHNMLMALIN